MKWVILLVFSVVWLKSLERIYYILVCVWYGFGRMGIRFYFLSVYVIV